MSIFFKLFVILRLLPGWIAWLWRNREARVSILSKRGWDVNKACRDHVKKEPACQWCGRTDQPQAHHVLPVWYDASKAADPSNFITLCGTRRQCHFIVGHNGDFARRFVPNVRELCQARQRVMRELPAGTPEDVTQPEVP